ncbi:hypothetical protein QTO34_006118 [Cnephaeus nilssonii]|uniref:Uncharacterized protein n=1 Tax=Cnephaeus nilssonii TaxID=3371016 RepID=A0AA40HM17_CNENI|nr:hypothetical protein QTO34_006118 [Eptesicus nilssonii]
MLSAEALDDPSLVHLIKPEIPAQISCVSTVTDQNQNQTRNCWQNHLDFHRCEEAVTAEAGDVSMCRGTSGALPAVLPALCSPPGLIKLGYKATQDHISKPIRDSPVAMQLLQLRLVAAMLQFELTDSLLGLACACVQEPDLAGTLQWL